MSFGKFVNMFQTHFLGICLLLVGANAVHYLLVNGAGSGEVYVNETVRTPQLQEPVVSDQDLIQDFTRDTTADSVKASGMAAEQPVEEIPAQIVMAPTETAEGDHDSSIYLNTLQAKDLTMPIFSFVPLKEIHACLY
jgi:hypothetical protein